MNREQLIEEVIVALSMSDEKNSFAADKILVNFWDDEIFWDRIATVAVDTILEIEEEVNGQ